MAKAKDGSECYTRTNKSGGKYVTCEGTQKSSKMSVNKKVTLEQQKRAQKRKKDREAAAKADKAIKEASDRIKKKKAQAKPKPKAKVPAIKVVKGTKKSIDLSPTESEVQTTTKDFYKLYPKDNQAQLNENDKKGNIIKRTIVPVNDLFDAIVKPLEKKGYSFSKNQLEDLQAGVTMARNLPDDKKNTFYATGPKKDQPVPPKTTTGEVTNWSFWYIQPSKGKTEMIIIYAGASDQKSLSTRVRKKK